MADDKPSRARTHMVTVRFSNAEFQNLKGKTEALNCTASDLVRMLACLPVKTVDKPFSEADYITFDDKAYGELIRQIRHWGYHLDHALHALNIVASKGFMTQEDTYELVSKAVSYIADVEKVQQTLFNEIKQLARADRVMLKKRPTRTVAPSDDGEGDE